MEVVVTNSGLLSRHSPGGAEERHKNLRIVGGLAEIITGYPPNASQKRYLLSQLRGSFLLCSPFSYPNHVSSPQ
jgi:hypothetical protein